MPNPPCSLNEHRNYDTVTTLNVVCHLVPDVAGWSEPHRKIPDCPGLNGDISNQWPVWRGSMYAAGNIMNWTADDNYAFCSTGLPSGQGMYDNTMAQ